MKMKSLLLTAALATCTAAADAQYVVDSTLIVPTATQASDVSDYGFTANWVQLTDDQLLESPKSIGFYVPVYAVKKARYEGDRFYLMNTDFSYLKSNGTVDDPISVVSMDNGIVRDYLNDPKRPYGWTVVNAGYADGVLCLDTKLNRVMANGQFALCYNDLRNGDGKVHVKFKVRSDGNSKTLACYLRDVSTVPNVNLDSYKIDDLTTEWREVEFTLQPKEGDLQRLKMSDVLFTCEDIGNLNKMFIFIDDMQVWQELHEGEVGRIMYTDNFIKDNIEATSLYFTTGDLLEGEQFAYAVCTYSLEAHSPESNMILVADGTGINKPAVSETTDASTPVTVYNLSGSVVARGTVGNMPAMPKGALIVKTGSQVKKVIVK